MVAVSFIHAFLSVTAFGLLAKGPFIVVAILAFVCGVFVFGSSDFGVMEICQGLKWRALSVSTG